jgi:putative Ca2+/H+ antiporter (TMEM165/GDT1 family)
MDLAAFLSSFGLVFVAELGDKTQLAVVTQTCKYRKPWAIFAGASAALVGVTALGVVAGQALGRVIPADLLQGVAAAAFIGMGLLVGREALRQGGESEGWDGAAACDDQVSSCPGRGAGAAGWNWRAFAATLGLLFVAELGDKTQLAVLSLSSNRRDAWAVLSGSALALTLVSGLGVVGGQALCELVPRRTLLWASALAFLAMGAWMGLSAL